MRYQNTFQMENELHNHIKNLPICQSVNEMSFSMPENMSVGYRRYSGSHYDFKNVKTLKLNQCEWHDNVIHLLSTGYPISNWRK